MGRKEHLSNKEKELISMLYRNTDKSLGAIAKFLGRDKSSVCRYKDHEQKLFKSKEENKKNIVKKPKNDTQVISLDRF